MVLDQLLTFDNVFSIATKLEYIVYVGFSRTKTRINCMADLLNSENLVNKHKNFIGKRIAVNWGLENIY